MLDEVAPEVLIIAGAGSVFVCLLMVVVWYVSTREDKLKKKKKDDKEVDSSGKNAKKKTRQHVSPRKKKESTAPKNDSPKVHPTPTEAVVEPPKSILKDMKDEPSPKLNQVDFQKELPVKAKPSGGTPRVNLPTPYPQSDQRLPSLGKSDEPKVKPALKDDKKHVQDVAQPKSSPTAQKSKPTSANKSTTTADQSTPTGSSEQQLQTIPAKKKPKTKQASSNEGGVSKVMELINSSSLSLEEVEHIMQRLLEQQDLDEDWEMTNRGDSVKTLKKNNAALQARCTEAENASQMYSNRVKELGADLRQEKHRYSTMESSLQGKSAKLQEELDNLKGKLDRTVNDLEEMKKSDSALEAKKLKDANDSFQTQLAQLAQQNSQQTKELSEKDSEIKKLKDSCAQLKKELKSAKEGSKNDRQMQQKVNDLQTRLQLSEQDNEQLQKQVDGINNERARISNELNQQKEMTASLKQELENAQKVPVKEEMVAVIDEGLMTTPPTNDIDGALKVELGQIKEELEKVRGEKETILSQQEQLQKTLTLKEADIKRISSELSQQKQENDKLRNANTDEITRIRASLPSEQTKSQTLKLQLESTSNGVDKNSEEEDDDNEEIERLKQDKQILHRKLAELKSTNETLREDSINVQQKLESVENDCKDQLKAQEIEEKKKISAARELLLTEQQEIQKQFLQRLFPKLKIEEEDFDQWRHQFLEDAEKELSEQVKVMEKKDTEVNELKKGIEENEQKMNQLKSVLSNTSGKFDELMVKWQEKEANHANTLDKERRSLQQAKTKVSQLEAKNEELEKNIQTLEEEVGEAKQEAQEFHRRYSQTDKITLQTEQEIQSLRKSLEIEIRVKEKLETEKDELTSKVDELNTAINELKLDKASLEDQVQKLQAQVDEATKARDQLKADKESTEGNTKELQDKVSELSSTVNTLEGTIQGLQNQVTQLNASIKQHSDEKEALEKSSKELQSQVAELNSTISGLNGDKDEFESKLSESDNKINKLEKNNQSLREANQDLHLRLSKLSSPPPQGTSSEV